ncbi:MAG: response regulator transcription factor [Erysipelotrichaceae bacterium]|nr:response regulator transcription factor [Erysipelotrichaceae bacterium]MDO5108799.1 response regulator transcription factor [Erysipelotrichaceae bacterium]
MNPLLNKETRTVESNGKSSHLTPIEFDILSYLMEHPDEVKSAEEIYENVWNDNPYDCHLVISVHVRHIREKIEANPSRPQFIRVLRGKGYRFNPAE